MKKINKKTIIVISTTILLTIIILIAAGLIYFNKINRQKEKDVVQVFASEENINVEDIEKVEEIEENEEIIVLENENPEEENKIENKENKENNESKQNENNSISSGNPYYIKVNYESQTVNVYTKDEDGKYTVPYKAMVCSTGRATPTGGTYKLPQKHRKAVKAKWIYLQGNVWGQYGTRITGNILFHSVPYERKSSSSLEWWEYDKLGTKASLGCVRLTVRDAKWIYDNCKAGTEVEFYASSNPGPLGKPSARKITNADSNIRIWDPTDSHPENPWKTYKEEKEEATDKENLNNEQSKNDKEEIKNEISNNSTDKNNVMNNTINNNVIDNDITNNNVINNTNSNNVSNNVVNEVDKNELKNNIINSNEINKNNLELNNDVKNEIKKENVMTNTI